MFAIALAASLDEVGAPLEAVAEKLLDAWPSVPADGRALAAAPRAAAGVLRWAVVDRDRRVVPIWDAERRLLFVGDVRLYNRRALCRELDIGDERDSPDAEIAWNAFLRWGEEAPKHLVGDFAFAVWDERTRSLFAARDHFGVRPLYYRVDRRSVHVASDVRQLLAATPDPFRQVNAQTILETFSTRRTHGLTYFRNIAAILPGHTVSIAAGSCRAQRYWLPPTGATRALANDEHSEVRALFRQAVRDRLESSRPIIAHSSGGFDSSAIIMAADRIYGEESGRPPLVMASALTPGMPCDDSRYMDAVARRVRFEGVRWNALQPNPGDVDESMLARPRFRRGIGGGPLGDLDLAKERDARVLLNGFFGDSLMYAFGVSRDAFRARRWRDLVRYVATGTGLRARLRLLGQSVMGLLPPDLALRALNRIENRSFGAAPKWMGPELRARFPPPPDELALPDVDWPSHLACALWSAMTSPRAAFALDSAVAHGAEQGIEVRLPYLDVRLAERLLTIPWEAWWPRDGDNRRFNRDALGPLLPEEFAQRRAQGSWMPVWRLAARRILPRVRDLLADGTWLSAPYVDRDQAKSTLADAMTDSVEDRTLLRVADFGALEAWLRRVFGYDAAARSSYV